MSIQKDTYMSFSLRNHRSRAGGVVFFDDLGRRRLQRIGLLLRRREHDLLRDVRLQPGDGVAFPIQGVQGAADGVALEYFAEREGVRGHELHLLVLGREVDGVVEDPLDEVAFRASVAELDVGLARRPQQVLPHVVHERLVLAALDADPSADIHQVLLQCC